MQLLCVHAEAFAFEGRNPDPDVDTAAEEPGAELGATTVVFAAVEPHDQETVATTTGEATATIRDVAEQLNTPAIALVPCRELTDSPANRAQASAVLDELAAQFTDTTLHQVPIGWDVAFDIETKAHPFAIQHYRIESAGECPDSDWLVYSDGAFSKATAETTNDELAGVLDREQSEPRRTDAEYVTAGESADLFDPAEDGVSLAARGVFARDVLADHVAGVSCEYGARLVQRLGQPTGGSVFRGRSVSEDDLPARLFEPRGRSTELLPDESPLPAATVPELTALVADLSAAFDEACEQVTLVYRLLTSLGLASEPVIRVSEDAYEHHSVEVGAVAAMVGEPVLVERRPVADWLLKVDFLTPPTESITTPTVVIEEWSPEIESGEENMTPRVVRALPAGALERTLGALLEDGPALPAWLAPVQLRLVPIDSSHRTYCEQLADAFEAAGIRVDIDDRETPVRERLAAADEEGIPYYTVIGDDELAGERVGVTSRRDGTDRELSPDELQSELAEETKAPTSGLALPRFVSEYV